MHASYRQSLRRRLARRVRSAGRSAATVVKRAAVEFFEDGCVQHAAAISYYGLFALFPLAILGVVAFGLVASDATVRETIVDFLLANVPLSPGEGRDRLQEALEGVTEDPGALGAAGLAGLAFAASGLMASIRNALNAAWDTGDDEGRPFLRGKLLDVLLVLAAGLVVLLSLALTVATRIATELAGTVEDALGGLGGALGSLVIQVGQLSSIAISFAIFAFLYRVVPAREVAFRDVWPGALAAALAYELLKTGFSFYLENFRDYSAVYGSLGAAVAFLFFVFLAANVFLAGAEIASEWPRVRAERGDRERRALAR